MRMIEVIHVTDVSDVLNVIVNNDMKKLEKSSSSFRAYYHRVRAELKPTYFELSYDPSLFRA